MGRNDLGKLAIEALAIEAEQAKQAGALGYMARALTMATLPHKDTSGCAFERKNGLFHLSILVPPSVGLPFGSIPRLLLSWVTTEAVRTGSPVLELGPTLSDFMEELGLTKNRHVTGGRTGNITRFRNQTVRLFSSTVFCRYSDKAVDAGLGFNIADEYSLWWDPKTPDQLPLWKSTVKLGSKFFQEIIERPVPIDLRALKALKRSPLALDIYCWLTHRMFYLQKQVEIPWLLLQLQFGADYANDAHGIRNFKFNFLKHLKNVCCIYPQAKVGEGERGLVLKPSLSHVATLPEPLNPGEWQRYSAALQRAEETAAATLPPPIIDKPPLLLQTETFEKAKRAAPGWDIYHLEREWQEWIAGKEKPKNPDAAFIAFCRKKYQREECSEKKRLYKPTGSPNNKRRA
jgi:hypothetical protein